MSKRYVAIALTAIGLIAMQPAIAQVQHQSIEEQGNVVAMCVRQVYKDVHGKNGVLPSEFNAFVKPDGNVMLWATPRELFFFDKCIAGIDRTKVEIANTEAEYPTCIGAKDPDVCVGEIIAEGGLKQNAPKKQVRR